MDILDVKKWLGVGVGYWQMYRKEYSCGVYYHLFPVHPIHLPEAANPTASPTKLNGRGFVSVISVQRTVP